MPLVCPHCHQQLEFSGPQPRFCSHCGQMLAQSPPAATIVVPADAPTLPPEHEAGAETVPPLAPADNAGDIPESVGQYRLLRRLGGGGMGTVYEALDTLSGRRVALKLLQPEYVASKEAIDRFRQEGELASKLAHPRCVFVLAADEDQGQPYIVMELMPGATLEGLVKEKGPLPPEQALRKILDVMDGLHEAHRSGLIHRDVKPSNCFLEADGRVKVGDFGLAKSLLQPAHLTRPGTFLGTPSFAAPEQIKMEKVDAQSDVYSVAATLYFLLTGRPPFPIGDPMATMARILTDDPPSMRTLRPDLPKSLDKVVLRGLERDRKRRWRSLDDFRRALLPFLPAEPSVGGVGLRFVAYFVDWFLLKVANQVLSFAFYRLLGYRLELLIFNDLVALTFNLTYFGTLEGIWGWSLGKRLLRLHVAKVLTNQPPGVGRALLRAGILYLLVNLGSLVTQFLLYNLFPQGAQSVQSPTAEEGKLLGIIGASQVLWLFLAIGLVVSTMRKRNGYRGLHEFLSGTRTYRLRWPQPRKKRALDTPEFHLEVGQPAGLPEQVGPYRIRGSLHWTPQDQTLFGNDVQLGRSLWLWLRPDTEPRMDEARRTANRPTRIRWVSCGTLDGRQWDAFLAPTGCPLPTLVGDGRRLSWAEFRGILEDITDELQASCAEGTLPVSLTAQQIWVGPGGQVQLLEIPLAATASEPIPRHATPANDQQRALAFLGEVAALALEGRSRPFAGSASPIQVPLPLYATDLLNRLFPRAPDAPGVGPGTTASTEQRVAEGQPPYDRIDQFQADLLATEAEPAEITPWMRAKLLLGHGLFVGLGIMAIALVFFFFLQLTVTLIPSGEQLLERIGATVMVISGAVVALFLLFLPVYLTRGGISMVRAGIAVVGVDGRQASRLRCLWRAFLAWGVVAVLAALAAAGIATASSLPWLGYGIVGIAVVLLGGYVALVLRNPARAPHDMLAGTYLVPR